MPNEGSRLKRSRFACASCQEPTDAPPSTKRAQKQLCRTCFGKKKDHRPRVLNNLDGSQWARYSKSIELYPDTRTKDQKAHGACFPKSLARQQIEIFTKRGQVVLDPFAGVGTTLEAALELGRNAFGIELNQRFSRMATRNLKGRQNGVKAKVITDDARNANEHLKPNSIDFVLTSPPYAGLLKGVRGSFAYKWREHSRLDPIVNPRPYSSRKEDLGNMAFDNYLAAVEQVMHKMFEVLKNECYAVWVVKDFRDIKNSIPFVNLHGEVINCAIRAGFTLWDIRIYDQTKYRPLVCLGFPSRNFYLNIGHSYLLTFKKQIRA